MNQDKAAQAIELEVKNNKPMVSSLRLAEHFGKEHYNVIRDIRQVMEDDDNFTELNFEGSEYLDSTGRQLPMFYLTRDAFMLVVMSYTGKEAMKIKKAYIQQFNQMEAELMSQRLGAASACPKKRTLDYRRPCSENQLEALMGLLGMRCKMDGIATEEAIVELCQIMHVNSLEHLQYNDMLEVSQYLWRSIFRIREKSTELPATKEERATLDGLIMALRAFFEYTHQEALDILEVTCNFELERAPAWALPKMEMVCMCFLALHGSFKISKD